MTTQELKSYIDRVLGNSIRCLLPSYWWKRLFGLVVDEIEKVKSALGRKASTDAVDELTERIEGVRIPKIKFYVPLLGIGSLTNEQITRNRTSSIMLRSTSDKDYIIEVLGVAGDKYYPSIPVWVYTQTDGRIRIAVKDDVSTFNDDTGSIIWNHLVYTIETDGSVSYKPYGLGKVVESYVNDSVATGTTPIYIAVGGATLSAEQIAANEAVYEEYYASDSHDDSIRRHVTFIYDSVTFDWPIHFLMHDTNKIWIYTTDWDNGSLYAYIKFKLSSDGNVEFVSFVKPDDALSDTSENPVQNKAVAAAIGDINTILDSINGEVV